MSGVNTLLTISKITNEALMVLENELTFTSEVNRDYDDQFAVTGAKIGSTVNVRRPPRFIGTTGPALSVEDFNETSIPVVLTTQFHIDTQFSTVDLALSLDLFSQRVLKPAIAAIANKIDRDGLVMATNNTGNIVGTPGTPLNSLLTFLTAGAFLDSEGAPRDGRRCVVLDPFTAANVVDSLKGLFMPSDQIGEQYRKGLMGRDSGGMNWKMDQNVVAHTCGTTSGATALTVNGANQGLAAGWAATSTISIASSANNVNLKQGDTVTFAGAFAVNPQNRQSYGKLRSFVLTADANLVGAGNVNLVVSPAVIFGGQFQNVTASPTTTGAVVVLGIVATGATNAVISPNQILFHKNAFTMAMADLELPEGVHFAGRASDKEIGLSIRVVRQYTINNDSIPTRLDVLYGLAPLYAELACRAAA